MVDVAFLMGVLVVVVAMGGIGYAIGSTRGQPVAGMLLGLMLGPIGWVIVLLMADQRQHADYSRPRRGGGFANDYSPPPVATLIVTCSRCAAQFTAMNVAAPVACPACRTQVNVVPIGQLYTPAPADEASRSLADLANAATLPRGAQRRRRR